MRLRITILLSCFMLAVSLYAKPASKKTANTDPAPKPKLTVCSITINSEEEINAFKSYLPAKDFNFVELTNAEDDDWFNTACKSGVKCDILVISGHFGGEFFGKSGMELSASEIEEHSCNNDCSGILDNPIEVFLFGCNTLAGKEEDKRTPEQYLNILIADGISREDAELTVAARYLEFERSFKTQAKISFSQVPHIYGFCAPGPLGRHIEGTLSGYLKEKVSYADWLRQEQKKRKDLITKNTQLIKKISVLNNSFRECSGISCRVSNDEDNTKYENLKKDICYFYVGKETVLAKLTYIRQLFERGKNAYFPLFSTIMDFFYGIDFLSDSAKYSTEEKQKYLEIQKNQKTKLELLPFLAENNKLSITQLFKLKMAYFMNKMAWLNDAEVNNIYITFIKDNFKNSVNQDFVDSLYSLPDVVRVAIGKVTKLEFINKSLFSSPVAIEAIGGILPQDLQIQAKIVGLLKDDNYELREAAIMALKEIKPQDTQIQMKIAESLEGNDLILELLSLQKEINPQDPQVISKIAECLKYNNESIKMATLDALGVIKPEGNQIHLQIANCLQDKSRRVRESVVNALIEIKPKDPLVQIKTWEYVNKFFQEDASWFLSSDKCRELKMLWPQDAETQIKLVEYLNDENDETKEVVQSILTTLKPKDINVHIAIAGLLKDKNSFVRKIALSVLDGIPATDSQIQGKMAECLQDGDVSVREQAIRSLGYIETTDPQIQAKIVGFLRDDEFKLREASVMALKWIKPTDKEVLNLIISIADDEDLSPEVRAGASKLLGDLAEGK